MDGKLRGNIKPGCEVQIMLKQDRNSGKLTAGVVKDILTNTYSHPHGIQARLTSGEAGQIKEIG